MNPIIKSSPDFTFVADQAHARLDSYLSAVCPDFSRSFFKKLIDHKGITVNGSTEIKASLPIKHNDIITISLPEKKQGSGSGACPINGVEILFEHEHFLIINKPAGLVVHKAHTYDIEPNLVDWLITHMPELGTIGACDRPGIVHRLDKDTSGLMIIARTHNGHNQFSQLFKNRTIHKSYLALVEGHPPKTGSIDLPIGRHQIHKHKMATFQESNKPGRRTALSHFQVISYFEQHSLVEIKPVTGRTHQIRVHMAAIGHPLIGDKTYNQKLSLPFNRHALHAHTLSFQFNNESFNFTQAIPQDMERLITPLSKI